MNEIKLNADITKKEVADFDSANRRRVERTQIRFFLWLLAIFAVFTFFDAYKFSDGGLLYKGFPIVGSGLLILDLLLMGYIHFRNLKIEDHHKPVDGIFVHMDYLINDDGIQLTREGKSNLIDWHGIYNVLETDEAYGLRVVNTNLVLIMKRFFKDNEENEFKEYLNKHTNGRIHRI